MSENDISQLIEVMNNLDKRLDRMEQAQLNAAKMAAHDNEVLERLSRQVIDLERRQAVSDYRAEKQDKVIVGGMIIGIMGFVGFLASTALLFLGSRADAGIPHIGGNP